MDKEVSPSMEPTTIMTIVKNNRLVVRVKPNARKSAVLIIKDGILHLAIAAPPEDGKANAEVERFLTRLLKRKATIKSGFTSKGKTVLLS